MDAAKIIFGAIKATLASREGVWTLYQNVDGAYRLDTPGAIHIGPAEHILAAAAGLEVDDRHTIAAFLGGEPG